MSTPNAAGHQNRMILLLIAGIPLTMILTASWLWYFVVEGDLDLLGALGTANHGTLLDPPRQIITTPFQDDAGANFAWTDLEPRWTMVVANPGPVCDEACERRLYMTRQIHIALGKEFNRVRRVLVSDTPVSGTRLVVPAVTPEGWPVDVSGDNFEQLLSLGHPGLVPLMTESAALSALFPELEAEPDGWYLVDPAGWIMMRFDDGLDYKAVLSDLKFLLKNSGGA